MKKVRSVFIKSIILPIADKAMKTSIYASIKQIKRMKQFPREEIKTWQNKHLQKLIHHAYNNSLYYNKLLNNCGLKPEDIQSKADLQKMVQKKELRLF